MDTQYNTWQRNEARCTVSERGLLSRVNWRGVSGWELVACVMGKKTVTSPSSHTRTLKRPLLGVWMIVLMRAVSKTRTGLWYSVCSSVCVVSMVVSSSTLSTGCCRSQERSLFIPSPYATRMVHEVMRHGTRERHGRAKSCMMGSRCVTKTKHEAMRL